MDLEEFITETLVSFRRGVSTANKTLEKNCYNLYGSKNPGKPDYMEFDVAVASAKSAGGNLGIKVLGSELGGGLFRKTSEQQISRIKFSITIAHSLDEDEMYQAG